MILLQFVKGRFICNSERIKKEMMMILFVNIHENINIVASYKKALTV